MKRICTTLVLFAFCLPLLASGAMAEKAAGQWELVMDKNGIKAYSRPVEGSRIFEFRAVAVVDAPIEVVSEMLRDVPACAEWLPYCDHSRLLTMRDRNHFSTYISLDLPWPLKNRDLVLGTDTEIDLVHGRAVTDLYNTTRTEAPEVDSHIRMPSLKGQYVFEFITEERTGIVHTYRADLAGAIPVWMANIATKYNMYDTFMNMKKMFEMEKYMELGKESPDKELVDSILSDQSKLKGIVVARLKEFIEDEAFIAMILSDKNIDGVLIENQGTISETLLYGWGSVDAKKKAVRGILEAYLASQSCDDALIQTVLKDEALTETILFGPKPSAPASKQIIENYLKGTPVMASK